MRIAKVIGTVTLNRFHPTLQGGALRLVVPLSLANLAGEEAGTEPLVAWDDLGAGDGSQIAISEGPEASRPFYPEVKPIDAYNAAILDELVLRLDPQEVRVPGAGS